MDKTFKIVFIGDPYSGKSSLLAKYIDPDVAFDHNRQATIGVDYKCKREKTTHVIPKNVKLSLWDTSGQKRFKSIISAYMRGMDCAVITFDLTNKKSFDSVINWIGDVKSNCQNSLIYIVGCKADSDRRVIDEVDISNLAHSYNVNYAETSALEVTGISSLFRKIATDCYNSRRSIKLCSIS